MPLQCESSFTPGKPKPGNPAGFGAIPPPHEKKNGRKKTNEKGVWGGLILMQGMGKYLWGHEEGRDLWVGELAADIDPRQ